MAIFNSFLYVYLRVSFWKMSYFDTFTAGYQGFDPYKKHVKRLSWNREIQMIGWWLVDDWFGATLTFKKNKMGIIISHELWIQFRSPSSILWKPRYSGIKTMVSCNVSLKSIHWSCYIPLYRQFFWFSHYFAGAITFFFDIPSSV